MQIFFRRQRQRERPPKIRYFFTIDSFNVKTVTGEHMQTPIPHFAKFSYQAYQGLLEIEQFQFQVHSPPYENIKFCVSFDNAFLFYCTLCSNFPDGTTDAVARHVSFTQSTPCLKNSKQICFCQNCVKFPPILIIFGRKMANDTNIYEVHSFPTSPNLRHHLTVLNANVLNCYITPNVVICNKLLKT